ncbi:Neuropeptide Y receptor [Armadillidium nasatum]|uniref:Neuropeptide Y receptor n=1 Tax=Armadillidium nasatum TaxID=96803 RepID=A0A5N5TEV7_9CRUS|nr:Neuropeptide Y receptor [Armadillidium nasatum]
MTLLDKYRLQNFLKLNELDQGFVNNLTSIRDGLSHTCDYCSLDVTKDLWTSGVCNYPNNLTFNICIYVLYSLILIIAFFGNILVVYTVFSSTKMKTVTNYYIANLAIGDLCMAIFCVPFSFLSTLILQYWPFGFHLCVTVNYLQAVAVFVSAYTLVAISIDRYFAIIYPLKPRMTRFQAKLIIISVWVLSSVTTLPIAIFSEILQPDLNFYKINNLKVCQENWGEYRKDVGAAYSTILMLLQYFLPIMVLLLLVEMFTTLAFPISDTLVYFRYTEATLCQVLISCNLRTVNMDFIKTEKRKICDYNNIC